ncbi:MAG: LuxR C-terminal-related transcriptional regulator [Bacteroidales bacterium]|nr:LuxR C-terminal-related transcriptional regulator [Bacteroidales bacterium]
MTTLNQLLRKQILTLTTIFCSLFIYQGAEAAHPLVRNFSRHDYGGGTQNWAVAQDHLGRMYFGNQHGLLRYDSKSWQLLHLGNYSTVRSDMVDSIAKRIYVGGSEDFGYFHHNEGDSKPSYRSLRSTLNDSTCHFNEVWNIAREGDAIVFQSDFHIFKYEDGHTTIIPLHEKITASALVGHDFYVGTQEGSLLKLQGLALTPMPGCQELAGKRIVAILPLGNDLLIATPFDGLYRYSDNRAVPYPTDIDSFLKENQIFSATTNGRELVLGTVNCGIAIRNLETGNTVYVNIETGLQNNTVLNCAFDGEGNLWLALDNGIDFIVRDSPMENLFGDFVQYGAGYASLKYGNQLFFGTNQGLYHVPFPLPSTPDTQSYKPSLKGQVWAIDSIRGTLFVANDNGLYTFAGPGFQAVEGVPGSLWIRGVPDHPDLAIVSTYDNFYMLRRENGRWLSRGRINGYNDAGGRFVIDDEMNLWISHWLKGVYRLHLNIEGNRFDNVSLYDEATGLIAPKTTTVNLINNDVVVSSEAGFYRYDARNEQLIEHEHLNRLLPAGNSSHLYQQPNGDLWSVSEAEIRKVWRDSRGNYQIDSVRYKHVCENIIPGYDNFNFIDENQALISNQNGFYVVNLQYQPSEKMHKQLFISRITGPQDTTLYSPTMHIPRGELKIPFNLNSLKFEFVYPEYRTENAVSYSYLLENYDHDWSAFSPANVKEYTKLYEGRYTLRVKALNQYTGLTDECSFTFTITPPFYRTWWAKLIYTLLIILAGIAIYRWIRNSSRRTATEMERRKEAEIVNLRRINQEESLRKDYEIAHLKSQQLEHDIKQISEELSNTTMNRSRKNQVLLDISDRLSKIQESANQSPQMLGRHISKLQQIIQENISHDDDWRNFTRHFDVVYENFLKRLTELHPNLTTSDQRICAYLKMGLSSKEIAPLINISYRSVEMTRYRLRKKMGLAREISLTDYLDHLTDKQD